MKEPLGAAAIGVPQLMTAEDVRLRLRLSSVRSVYRLVDEGALPCRRIGKRLIRFAPEDVAVLVGEAWRPERVRSGPFAEQGWC